MANLGDISKINLPNGNVVNIKDKIARESLVPAVGSSDNSKVLTASYNNGEGSYSWQPASGGGTSDVIQGYYYNNKFYEDSSHTIEIQGEVDKLYADIGSATDGWDLYMWANKAGNNAFTSIYDRLYKEGIAYGTCDTGSSTAAKTVSITGFKLQAGSIVTVKFTNALSLSSAKTLNVNDTGAKSITYNNSSTWSYQFAAGSTITFMYDGLKYAIVSASPGVQSASSGGTTITEVTTGDKYSWNNKPSLTSSITPKVNGTAAVGTSSYAARADHIHPTDTTRQAKMVVAEANITVGTDWTDTGMSFTLPSSGYAFVVANLFFNASDPRGIKIQSSGGSLPACISETTNQVGGLSTSGIVHNYSGSSMTYKVYAKSKSSGSNRVQFMYALL